MVHLRHSQLQNLSRALLELYIPTSLEDLPKRVFSAASHCFSCDYVSYNEFGDNSADRIVASCELSGDVRIFEKYLYQHPSANMIVRRHIQTAVTFSDFVSLASWHRTDLYNLFFKSRGTNYQLAFLSHDSYPRFGLALNRSSRDFSEEERSLMNIFIPHLIQAYKAGKLFSHFSALGRSNGQAYIDVTEDDQIRFATDAAARYLEIYFGAKQFHRLPSEIVGWLKQRRSKFGHEEYRAKSMTRLSVRKGAKQLNVESLSSSGSKESRLVLTESLDNYASTSLEGLELTKREAEVLFWVSQGKRNMRSVSF